MSQFIETRSNETVSQTLSPLLKMIENKKKVKNDDGPVQVEPEGPAPQGMKVGILYDDVIKYYRKISIWVIVSTVEFFWN